MHKVRFRIELKRCSTDLLPGMKALRLEANRRMVTGRKVKNLRNDGVIPATIYGKTTKPISVQTSAEEFVRTYGQTGETGLIHLTVDGEDHPVLVKNVQLDPVSSLPIHIEFHQVSLKEKIRAHVPIIFTGEAQAIKEKVGTLLQLLNEIEVEALPADLPEHIEVNISGLINVNDHMTVKELSMPQNVTLLTDPEIMVVKIGQLLAPEPEPTPAPPEGVAVEGEEGAEAKAEEEKGTEEKKEAPEKPEEPPKKE
jgi:large subunit ribosomal protein L25